MSLSLKTRITITFAVGLLFLFAIFFAVRLVWPSAETVEPRVPRDIAARSTGNSIKLSWRKPKDATNDVLYFVWLAETEDGAYKRQTTKPTEKTRATIKNLAPGKNYYVKISAAYKKDNDRYNQGKLSDAHKIFVGTSNVPPQTEMLYVSSVGDSGNPCSETLPCRQPAQALQLVEEAHVKHILVMDNGPFEGFHIENIKATESAPLIIEARTAGTHFSSFQPYRTGNAFNILISNSSYVNLKNIRIRNEQNKLPENAVRILQSDHISLERADIQNCSKSCILSAALSHHITVSDSTISGSQKEHGIYISESSHHNTLKKNTIFNNTRAGIQVNAEKGENERGDASTGLSMHNQIENNVIYNNATGLNLLGVRESNIVNNAILNNSFIGIALDQAGALKSKSGADKSGPADIAITNNTVTLTDSATQYAMQIKDATGKIKLRNNAFLAPTKKAIKFFSLHADDKKYTDSDYNLFLDGSVIATNDEGATVLLPAWQAGVSGQHTNHEQRSVTTNTITNVWPANSASLSNEKIIVNQLTSPSSSPAKNKGERSESTLKDILDKQRNGTWDIGAYEHTD